MNHEHDPIVCESEKASLTDALEKSTGAGNRWKTEAELLEVRVRELERNRDEFQARRDEAIREAERKTVMLNRIVDSQPIAGEVAKLSIQPGDLILVSIKGEQSTLPEQVQAVGSMMLGLKKRYPGVTFITSFGVLFDVTQMSETELRKHGLISAARVDAGVQQLEVAFGVQKTALERCRFFLNWAKNWVPAGRECGELHEFLPRLEGLLQAELVPEERPTRETLLNLLRRARRSLVWNTDGDARKRPEDEAFEKEIDAALGETLDQQDAREEGGRPS